MTEPNEIPEKAPSAASPTAASALGSLQLRVPLLIATLCALFDLYIWVVGPGFLLAAALGLTGFGAALLLYTRGDRRAIEKFSAACIYGIAVALMIGGVRIQEEQAQLNAAVLIVATETYRHQAGEWPAELQELVPRFMARIPPVSLRPGHRFTYRRTPEVVTLTWPGILPGSHWQYELLLSQLSHEKMLSRGLLDALRPTWWRAEDTP